MMLVQHYKGSKEHYDANVHSGIYFATDTKEIILDNEVYLGGLQETVETLQEQVDKNTADLLSLGDSIQEQISLAIDDFANKLTDDRVVNTFKELVMFAADNAENANIIGQLVIDVNTLKESSASKDDVATLDNKFTSAVETLDKNFDWTQI
jgi:hypothetical protein